ncbi:MAG: hypothetical protein KY457_00520 [Actinobacteria bacterium]|nr:hypothetical protein [Actinomycetota bacterium]
MSELTRTYLSALAAGLLAFVMVAGLGVFLIPGAVAGSVIAGLVASVLATGLLLAAAKRSGHLERDVAGTSDAERRLLDPEGTRAPHDPTADEDDRG